MMKKKKYNCNKCWTDHKKITIVIFMIAESSILIILDSYISCSKAVIIIMIITKYLFFWIIRTLMIAYKLTKKYFSRVCIKARSVELFLQAASFLFPNRRLKDVHLNNQYNNVIVYHEDDAEKNHCKEMQFSAHYS